MDCVLVVSLSPDVISNTNGEDHGLKISSDVKPAGSFTMTQNIKTKNSAEREKQSVEYKV